VRINQLSAALRQKRVDMPTAVLLNLRGRDAVKKIEIDAQGDAWLVLDEDTKEVLYVVDGQHRILAVDKLYREEPDRWAAFRIQFVLMVGATTQEEMEQFYVVNSTAKSVRTDLALDLLKQRADADGRVMEQAIERGERWKIQAQAIVERLNGASPIWKGKIRLANEDKGDSIIPAASFVNSLKSVLASPFVAGMSEDQQVRLLDAYWQGIRVVCREPFDGDSDRYALQKGVGVTAMHDLLVMVIEHIRSSGGSVFDLEAYARLMEPVLLQLEGDNLKSDTVSGADFWLTAPHGGAAGTFSSSAGRRVLLAKLSANLPVMQVE
jgi:DGQHR domain-containing protein